MCKVVIKILQGSLVTQTVLGGLTICILRLLISYSVLVAKIHILVRGCIEKVITIVIRLTFWATVFVK